MTVRKMTKAEDALHSFTCNAHSILTGLLKMENDIEQEQYSESDRLDFEHFRFCVMDTLAIHASVALEKFFDSRK